jgi:hypothetical protein
MLDKPRMPDDWDDHAGSETYYRTLPSDDFWYKAALTDPGSFSFDRLGSLIDEFREKNWMTLWFPGCGYSPLPRAFALFGFRVFATDIAPAPVEYQTDNTTLVQARLSSVNPKGGTGAPPRALESRIHDFRTPFGHEVVDAIFNVKSFQGLPAGSMAKAAHTHFTALRPGGLA